VECADNRHAHFSDGDYESAVDAYEAGLRLDPANANMKAALATAKARVSESSSNTVADREPAARSGGAGGGGGAGGMPDLASLASMMGGMGGGGGGMPDLASLMQNPQMMQMYVFPSLCSILLPHHSWAPQFYGSDADIQGTTDDAERWFGQDDAKPKHQADGRTDAEWRWDA